MKTRLLALISFLMGVLAVSAFAAITTITGAGATFPYPLYVKWAQVYKKQTDVSLNYQPIGSGGGIKQIQANTVDFGASDKPLATEELTKSKLVQFPTVIGGVVPVVNIAGIQSGQIKLSGPVLADIYLGKITKWNDAKIKAINPDVQLPDQNITVVHRSDGSGTTFLFTNYLSKVSPTWNTQVGSDTAISWPAGIGGKGNEGVSSYVQRVNGSIEYAYAKQNKLTYIQIGNKSGNYVPPSIETFQAAAAHAKWSPKTDFAEILTNEAGAKSWPISGATFILLPNTPNNPERVTAVLKFFDWAYRNGKELATELDYVPLPDNLISQIEDYWKQIKDTQGQPVWK
jgi:phosphate transport system substrate-binding protein